MFLAGIKCLGNVQHGEISEKDCLESYIFPFTSLWNKAKHLSSIFMWCFKIFVLLVIKVGPNMNLWDGTSSRHIRWRMCLPAYICSHRNHGYYKSKKKYKATIMLFNGLCKCTTSNTDYLHRQELYVNIQNGEVFTAHGNTCTFLRVGTMSARPLH